MWTNTPSTSLPPLPLTKESIDAIQYDAVPALFQKGDLVSPTDNITNRFYTEWYDNSIGVMLHTWWYQSDRLIIIVYDIEDPRIRLVQSIRIWKNYDPSDTIESMLQIFKENKYILSLTAAIKAVALKKLENTSID
jgi:hypothetical protein